MERKIGKATIMIAVLLMSMALMATPIVKASGTIYIRADGSIDPPTAPIYTVDNITYTLTGNITSDADGIVIERNNIVLNGAGYTVQGTGYGIFSRMSNIEIKNAEITEFYWGIWLESSLGNSISGNTITCYAYGIWLESSSSNNISGNTVANNWGGIWLEYSSSNDISGNTIANGDNGLHLDYYSLGNRISGNNITNNGHGIMLWSFCSGNSIYHNHFVNNTFQVFSWWLNVNVWDDGYPSGGNYWSDYNGTDLYSGPSQNITGSDGIGDTPYVIDEYNQDRYPFLLIHDIAITNVAPSKTVVCQGYSTNINVTVANQGDSTETFNVTLYANPGQPINETGLVGYWKFDEGSGTIAYDSSENNNYGTIYGATWVDGKIGKALSFDQLGQYINVLDSNSLDIGTSNFTLAAWVYSEDRSGLPYGAGAILSKTLLGWPPPGYFFGILNNGSIYFELTRSPGGPENVVNGVSNVPVPMNEWHYVVIAFQRNGNAIFYLDGNQVGSVDISSEMGDISNDRPLLIGESETYSNQFKGDIDEVKIYNRALTADEVWTEYTRTGAGFAIQTQSVTLESGASTIITFTWNTTGFAKGNYTIWAHAHPDPPETDPIDNTFIDGWIIVSMVGDVTGPDGWPDGKCDMRDIRAVAKLFGINYPDPRYNCNCDVTGPTPGVADGKIDMRDIRAVAKQFGKIDP